MPPLDRIKSGKLSVVLIRSAQKFDMFGFDDLQGGITTIVSNRSDLFKDLKPNEVSSKSAIFQGITFNHKILFQEQEEYRRVIQINNKLLYDLITKNTKTKFPLKATFRTDNKIPFVYFNCSNKNVWDKFISYLKEWKIPFQQRSSFGFPLTNLNWVGYEDGEARLSIGLESSSNIHKIKDAFIKANEDFS